MRLRGAVRAAAVIVALLFAAPLSADKAADVTVIVDATLTDGTVLQGNFSLNPQERIIDMLNDECGFLPFADTDGVVTVVAKAAINTIRPRRAEGRARRGG